MRTVSVGAHTLFCFSFCLFVCPILTVLRLPPGLEAVGGEGGDHVLNGVADGVSVLVIHLPGVAHKTFFLLLMDRGHRNGQFNQSTTKTCPHKPHNINHVIRFGCWIWMFLLIIKEGVRRHGRREERMTSTRDFKASLTYISDNICDDYFGHLVVGNLRDTIYHPCLCWARLMYSLPLYRTGASVPDDLAHTQAVLTSHKISVCELLSFTQTQPTVPVLKCKWSLHKWLHLAVLSEKEISSLTSPCSSAHTWGLCSSSESSERPHSVCVCVCDFIRTVDFIHTQNSPKDVW